MKIFVHELESTLADQLETEIRFVIASARAMGNELVSLKIKPEADGKIVTALTKQLKTIKKQGIIDFSATKDAFSELNAEASYLINKFPEVTEHIGSEEFFVIVKI